jgi:uncharacterized protein
MSAFRASATSVLRQATSGALADAITDHIQMRVSPAERRSWTTSLAVLAQDLVDAGLGQVEMLCEYQLHPGVQVGDYCGCLSEFLGVLAEQPDAIRGATYLHNAARMSPATAGPGAIRFRTARW